MKTLEQITAKLIGKKCDEYEDDCLCCETHRLVELAQKEGYEAGYKQGVEDEVKCIETSGEHGEAVKKIFNAGLQAGAEVATKHDGRDHDCETSPSCARLISEEILKLKK